MRLVAVALWAAVIVAPGVAQAQYGYPPPASAQDAACRGEARSRVLASDWMSQPLSSLHVLGRRFWDECMARGKPAMAPSAQKRRG